MKQVVQQQRSGILRVAEVPPPRLRPEGVLVLTVASVISAGTERAKVAVARKSLIGKALARPDQVRQVLKTARDLGIAATYQKVLSKLDALSPLGYSAAGIVHAVGDQVRDISVGDRVACAGGGYANHASLLYVPATLVTRVPDDVPLEDAAYATLGAISLQGVRQAEVTLGETVGVIGLGLLGLFTVQLLRAAGCRVVGIDTDQGRCDLARRLGADVALPPDDGVLESTVRRVASAGLDAVILTASTTSSQPVELAGTLARDRARVVVVGAVGMDVPRAPFYDKELDLRLSRSYGPGRYDPRYEEQAIDYPIGYVRWTEGRNLAAIVDLLAQRKLDVRTLTTHRFGIDEAEKAYELVEGKTGERYLGVVLTYGGGADAAVSAPIPVQRGARTGPVGLAVIGAGSFAQSMLLPHLKADARVRLRTVVTQSGTTARSVAERFGFEQCGSDPRTAWDDPGVSLAIVASRHASHAALAADGLRAGKAVFVEKPLALTHEELRDVVEAWTTAPAPFLMVGFNRRFAQQAIELRGFMREAGEPLLMHYRVNAGFIARDHWTQDRVEGGGRVRGEICHFVDLLLWLAGHPPVEVFAQRLPDLGRYSGDNVSAQIRFRDGSVGTITYAANGDRSLPKERLEVFGGSRAAVLDDFRELTLASGGRRRTRKASPDKGHRGELKAVVDALVAGADAPIPPAELIASTLATLAVDQSLETGEPVPLDCAW